MPVSGQTATYSWTGTIPGGANADSDCSQSISDSLNDHHTVTFDVPTDFYSSHTVLATFKITPAPPVDDVILTVEPDGTVVGSDDSWATGGAETLSLTFL